MYGLDSSTGEKIWEFYASSYEIRSSPALAGGFVFFGDENLQGNAKIYSLNASSGALVWEYETEGEKVDSSPAIINGQMFIGASDGYLYSFKVGDISPEKVVELEESQNETWIQIITSLPWYYYLVLLVVIGGTVGVIIGRFTRR